MTTILDKVLSIIDKDFVHSLERLFDILRIPSISTDPHYDQDCLQAANWLVQELSRLGFTVSLRPTPGKPMVFGHWQPQHPPQKTILFYGHYDVQPVDPLGLWESDPFDPQIRVINQRKQIFARGASDDKGQFMTFIEACRSWLQHYPKFPVAIKILLEGEEETGSPNLVPFLELHKEELEADTIFVCDTPMWKLGVPALTTSLRGLMVEEIVITAANRDLHSGFYGGVARNPIHVLARIVADIHDTQGRIHIPGFYEQVTKPSKFSQPPDFEVRKFFDDIGLSISSGEIGYNILEQLWTRPSCDVNGIYGGYTGTGSKTVIPSKATAKVSFRLVDGQDPEVLRSAFRTFITERVPADCKVNFIAHSGSKGVVLDHKNTMVQKVSQALHDEFQQDPVYMGCGATIPIVSAFQQKFHIDCVLVGFALEDDCIHSPNEKYDLNSFYQGIRSWVRVFDVLED